MNSHRFIQAGRRFGHAMAVGAALLLAGCGGGADGPPASPPAVAITAQPADQSVVAGTPAAFSVTTTNATGYQWQRSGDGGMSFVDVPGATGASHTTPATSAADNGTQYRVVVAGAANRVTSSAATLTVVPAPVAPSITVQPTSQRVTAPAPATFSVTATGTALAYQWQRCTDSLETCGTWVDIAGATGPTYTTGPTAEANQGDRVRVAVRNTLGSVASNAVELLVDPTPVAPTITRQPVDVTVTAPDAAVFSVAYTGVPEPLPNWQYSNDGVRWLNLGVFGPTLTIGPTSLADSGRRYRAEVNGLAGTVVSAEVTLTVTGTATAPAFTTQPASVTIEAGTDARFEVAASGSPSPGLQWQLSTDGGATWNNIVGATSPVLDVVNAAQGDSGRRFRAVASNSAGAATSNAAVLTVTAPTALTVITNTQLPEGTVNQPYAASLQASGGTPPYRWSTGAASVLQTYGLALGTDGQITGTPNGPVQITFYADVTDSATAAQTATKELVLKIEPVCIHGRVEVAGAPNTVQGRLCSQSLTPPSEPLPNGLVNVGWSERVGGVFKSIGVQFNPANGQIESISFGLSDPQRLLTYICARGALPDYPACTGAVIDPVLRTLDLTDTVVGSGSVTPFTLNGQLRY